MKKLVDTLWIAIPAVVELDNGIHFLDDFGNDFDIDFDADFDYFDNHLHTDFDWSVFWMLLRIQLIYFVSVAKYYTIPERSDENVRFKTMLASS